MKQVLNNLTRILVIILIFTGLDWLVHQLKSEFAVPDYYFRNKIIFGFILGAIVYFFIRQMQNPVIKSFLFFYYNCDGFTNKIYSRGL